MNSQCLNKSYGKSLDKGYIGCAILNCKKRAKVSLNGIYGVYLWSFKQQQYDSIISYDSSLAKINCDIPQESILGSFLLHITGLNQPINFADYTNLLYLGVHHFADDTNFILKLVNIDLKRLVNQLNANKVSVYVIKTEAIIFKFK